MTLRGVDGGAPLGGNRPKDDSISYVVQENEPANIPIVEVQPDKDKGLKIESKNKTVEPHKQARQRIFLDDWADGLDRFMNEGKSGPAKIFRLVLGTLGYGGLGALGVVCTGLGIGCSHKREFDEFYEETITKTDSIPGTPGTPGTPATIIPGKMTKEEYNEATNKLFNAVIDNKNNGKPKTDDNVEYKYVSNADGTGSVIILNKDGSESNIKLGFNPVYELTNESTDPETGNWHAEISLMANPTSAVSNSIVAKYIKVIGDNFNTADGVVYNFIDRNGNVIISVGNGAVDKSLGDKITTDENNVNYIKEIGDELETTNGVKYSFGVKDGKAQVTYGTTGFTHIVGEPATVTPDTPLGKVQGTLEDLAILPKMNGKIATQTQTSTGAWGTGKGVHFEVVPGDLKEVTQGNPTVKMNFNDMQGHEVDIEGKLEIAGNGVKITDKSGKVLTMTPQEHLNISDEEYTGVSVSYDGKEVFRMAKDNFNGKEATILAHVEHDEDGDYTDTDTFFTPNEPKSFDGEKSVKEADVYYHVKETNLKTAITEANTYFNEKKVNLETAYKLAVDAIKGLMKIEKGGTIVPGDPGTPGTGGGTATTTTHTEVDIQVTIK